MRLGFVFNKMSKSPTSLIINSPSPLPTNTGYLLKRGSRLNLPKVVVKPDQDSGKFVTLPLVNQIRERVDAWSDAGYPGVTGITKTLEAELTRDFTTPR